MLPLLALGLVAGGAGLAAKGINYVRAGRDKRAAERALQDEQSNPYAQYSASGELNRYYSDAVNSTINPQGLTAGEKTAFQNNLNQTVNTLASNASRGSGGSMNRYIIGALNPSVISANNTLVAQDAAAKRADKQSAYGRLGTAVSALQGIKDRNTMNEIQRKMMREQYLGQSVLQNKAFQSNTLDSIGSDLLGGGLMLGMNGFSGGSSTSGGRFTKVNPTAPINGSYNYNYIG